MTTLAETEQNLRVNLEEKLPLLSGIDSGRIEGFLNTLLGTQPFVLDDGQLTQDGETIVVNGKAVLMGVSNDVEGRFEALNGTTSVTLATQLGPETALEIPGLTEVAIQDISLTLKNSSITTESDPIDFFSISMSGKIHLEGLSLPITLTLPDGDQEYWLVEGDFESIQMPDMRQLGQLAGVEALASFLPETVIQAGNLAISDVQIGFDPVEPSIDFVFVGLKLPPTFDLIPGMITLLDGEIYLRVFSPTDSLQRAVTGTVDGNLQLGDTLFHITSELPHLRFNGSLAEGSTINLGQLTQAALFSEISLPQNLSDLELSELTIRADREDNFLSLYGRSFLDWPLLPDLVTLEAVAVELQHTPGANEGAFEGTFVVAGEQVEVSGELGAELTLRGQLPDINLSTLLEDVTGDALLPLELPDFMLSDIDVEIAPGVGGYSVEGSSVDAWDIPVGVNGVSLSDIQVQLQTTRGADGKPAISGAISGTLRIGATSLDMSYNFPGDFILGGDMPAISLSLLLQEFCGGEMIRDLPLPVSILETELGNVTFSIAPQQKRLSFAAESALGQVEIIISQTTEGDWGFSIGFVPPDAWSLSAIDPALAVLNELDFGGSALIVSSSDDRSLALTSIALPQGDVAVRQGLNFFASLDASALGVKELLPGFDLDRLQVYAAIGNNLHDMVIEAAIEGEFEIDESTTFGDITLRLKPSPTDFEVALFGTVSTVIDDSPLLFIGGLGITGPPPAGTLQATMVGTWDNPFGVQNLSVSDVALDLRLPPPAIGITGGLRVGDFEGRAAVGLNAANPTHSMLAVEFNELQLVDVFDAFCPPQVRQAIPRSLVTTILDVAFEDVKIHIVPQATTIGEVAFEQGITLQGRMIFWGLKADGFLSIDQTTGIVVKGDVDNIVLGNIFKLTGAAGNSKASLYADLRMGQPTRIDINGAVELLGISREAALSISDAGFSFTTTGKIFGLFEAGLTVRGSDMASGDGITIRATMRNDLFDYLSDKASAAIEAAAKEATREIDGAQRALNRAQAEVNRLNSAITAMRHTIEAERARDSSRLRDAHKAVQTQQNKVNSLDQQIRNMRTTIQRERDRDAANLRNARNGVQTAQNKVNGLNRDISNMQRTVQAERDRDSASLRQAQRAVNSAQKEVDKIQREINSTKSRIKTINKQIAAKKKWLDKRAWHEMVWAGPEYAAYEAAKRTEQGALYTKIGGLETAKHTALGSLEAAKWSLRTAERAVDTFPINSDPRVAGLITARATATVALNAAKGTLQGLEKAAKTFPIEADPRMVGLFTAKNAANGALASAKLALKGIEAAIKVFPIEADPRMIGLISARETATAGLQVATFALEGIKQSVKGMAQVSQFIADGLSELLVIHAATFETSLSAAHGGDVSLAIRLTFMGEAHDLALRFDFNDPLSSVEELVGLLLPG